MNCAYSVFSPPNVPVMSPPIGRKGRWCPLVCFKAVVGRGGFGIDLYLKLSIVNNTTDTPVVYTDIYAIDRYTPSFILRSPGNRAPLLFVTTMVSGQNPTGQKPIGQYPSGQNPRRTKTQGDKIPGGQNPMGTKTQGTISKWDKSPGGQKPRGTNPHRDKNPWRTISKRTISQGDKIPRFVYLY